MEKELRKYKKDSPNLVVEVSDSESGETLFSIQNKNTMNISEMFSDAYVDSIIKKQYEGKVLPKSITVMAYSNYDLIK